MKACHVALFIIVATVGLFVGTSRGGESKYSPKPSGDYLFFENFEDTPSLSSSRWVVSSDPDYTGRWNLSTALDPELDGMPEEGDKSLVVRDIARKHAISVGLSEPIRSQPDTDFVLQFEVRPQHYLECGGAYIKLLRAKNDNDKFNPQTFSNEQPYAIMFGPDKCGGDVKLHFIFQRQNPISGRWEEKALRPFPSFPTDMLSHLYTLHISSEDNTYEVLVDGESYAAGSLFEDFEPPVDPPAEIDDPEDHKPADWVDDERIPDPTATKPDDWDEEAPMHIVDETDSKPDDWDEDASFYIADPAASKPSEWDDELDGEWEAPLVFNPSCELSGCGPWEPRLIANPLYKGKWSAPLIDNPAFIGVWSPRQIPNPYFFHDTTPAAFPDIVGLGFELWTMTNWISFDNILITRDRQVADDFAEKTFYVKHAREQALNEKVQARIRAQTEPDLLEELTNLLDDVFQRSSEDPLLLCALIAFAALIPIVVACCCCSSDSAPPPRHRPDTPRPDSARSAQATQAATSSASTEQAATPATE